MMIANLKRLSLMFLAGCFSLTTALAQGEMDALTFNQYDLVGTARYVGMGGAFGALGGDVTTLSQNPAGIGVYRGTELSATLNFSTTDVSTKSPSFGSLSDDKFKFSCDNFGYVTTFHTNFHSLMSFNVGFAYNRQKSFNRDVKVGYNDLQSSLANYAAAISDGVKFVDLAFPNPDTEPNNTYNPYFNNSTYVPWLGILSYAGYLIEPEQETDQNEHYEGVIDPLLGDRINSDLIMHERGAIDEYTFNFGGNIADRFYFGVGVGVVDLDYESTVSYSEYADWTSNQGGAQQGTFELVNNHRIYGTGFNFKFGGIYKLLPYWRVGFAVHTPTFHSVSENYQAFLYTENLGAMINHSETEETPYGRSSYDLRTPWRFIASTAYVFRNKGLISFDYEYVGNQYTKFTDDYGDFGYSYENGLIKEDMQGSHTFRVGAEYRLLPQLSVRAGYVNQLSPIKNRVRGGQLEIPTPGTRTSYYLDKGTQYYTCGLGYRFSHFYMDGAFVYRSNQSNLLAFSPLPDFDIESEVATMKSKRMSFVFTLGYKF